MHSSERQPGVRYRSIQFLCQSWHSEDEVEVESGAPAGVLDVVAASGPEQVVCERPQTGGDVWVLANA